MKSTANTLIRILAWACIVLGVLFTMLQAWLAGIPLLIAGALILVHTRHTNTNASPATTANVGEPAATQGYEHTFSGRNIDFGSGADARDPLFGVGERHLG